MPITNFFTTTDLDNILNDFGRQQIRVPITKVTTNYSGKETLSGGTPVAITIHFVRTNATEDYVKAGLNEIGDAIMVSKRADNIDHNDLICTDGVSIEISNIDGDATTITVDTSSVHGLSAGDEVLVLGTTNYDGLYTVAAITDTDTFTITDSNHDVAAETSGQLQKSFGEWRAGRRQKVYGVFDDDGGASEAIYDVFSLFLNENE